MCFSYSEYPPGCSGPPDEFETRCEDCGRASDTKLCRECWKERDREQRADDNWRDR